MSAARPLATARHRRPRRPASPRARRLRLRFRGHRRRRGKRPGRRRRPRSSSADAVKIGYFPQPHPRDRAGRASRRASSRRSWAAPRSSTPTFNAGPSEIEALNAGSIDIGWIGPSPAINGYTKSERQEPADHRRFGVRRREAGRQPEEDQDPGRPQGQEDRHPAARQHPGRGVPQLDRRAGLEGRRAERQGRRHRSSAPTTRSPRTPSSPAPSTAPGCRSRPRPSWSPRAARCCSTRRRCGRTRSS